jgi:hypothetical protein
MNKLIKAFCLTMVLSLCVVAQSDSDDYNRNEFFAGYSNQQVNDFSRQTHHGFEVSVVRNFHRYFGVKGDFSAAFRNRDSTLSVFNPTGTSSVRFENDRSIYNFLGGIQIKDNASKARLKPFAHALIGVAHNRNKTKNITCVSNCSALTASFIPFSLSDTGFAGAFGGGLDIKINDKIDFRAIQVDYNPVFSGGRVNDNVRFGIGFVFK